MTTPFPSLTGGRHNNETPYFKKKKQKLKQISFKILKKSVVSYLKYFAKTFHTRENLNFCLIHNDVSLTSLLIEFRAFSLVSS